MPIDPQKKLRDSWKFLMRMRDPDHIFDLVVWGAYMAGTCKAEMPFEEARKVFIHIKKLWQK